MRKYAKVTPAFWTGETGRLLRGDANSQRVALYLLTCPSANMIGLYYLPLPVLIHEIGLSRQGALKALRRVSEVGFAQYDDVTEHVWVPEMACYQIGKSLKADDNRRIAILKKLEEYSKCKYLNDFMDKYGDSYQLYSAANPKPPRSPLEDPSETLRSQRTGTGTGTGAVNSEQEQEKQPPKPPARSRSLTKLNGLDFDQIKNAYPKRSGSQPWTRAAKAANARIKEGALFSDLLEGTERYALFCTAVSKTETEFVMQAATFFGPEKHYLEPWKEPETKDAKKQRELAAHQEERAKRWAAEDRAKRKSQ